MRKLAQLGFLILVMLQLVSAALGQGPANTGGLLIASNFTGWSVSQGNNGNYNWTSNTFCRVSAGGLTFNAFTVGVPVYLADTSAPNTSEVVTPTVVTINNSGCSIRINPVNQHQTFYFRSATAGLGEAIGYANSQNFQVILTPQWTSLGGQTSMITSSIGSNAITVLDQRSSVIVPYIWGGSAYVAQPFGGGGSCPNGCVTSVNAVGSGPINGAVQFQGAGNTTVTQTGQIITVTSTGSGTSPLGTLPFDLPVNNVGGTAAVDTYNFYATTGYTAQQAMTAAIANNGTVTIQPTAGRVPFTVTGNHRVNDMRADVPATAIGVTENGAVCDLRSIYGTYTSGSKAFTVTNGTLTSADVGREIVAVGAVAGLPTAFESILNSVSDSAHGIVTTNFPFTSASPLQMDLGHDDTSSIGKTMVQVGAGGTLVFPEGNCLSHTQILSGQAPIGLGINSQVTGFPGEDIFQAPDPSQMQGISQGGVHIHDLTFFVDSRIDATLPWQIINDSGTTSKAAMYRPIAQKSPVANNPMAPGWFQGSGANGSGAFNAVANVQAASAVMCVPNTVTIPSVGQSIVFPYLTSVFTTTVANNSGSCSAGFTARTLSAPMPAGSTNAQAEFFAGTSPQNLSVAIGSGSCPTTITLSNSINPVPGFESNVAPFGLIQIDAEQIAYTHKSMAGSNPSPANTLYGISCAQNGTARAAHSTSATVVPLNQYKPAYPWPVTPTINASDTTPQSTAGFYPGWPVGNAAFAFPLATGINQASGNFGGWSANARIENLSFAFWPSDGAANWQEVNHTAMYYYALPSYATTFSNLLTFGLFYGVAGGPPSIENGNWANQQPTADGTHYDGLQIFAANPVNIPYGNENTFSNLNVYSNEQTAGPGGSSLGADTCFYFTQLWDDQNGGAIESLTLDHFKNLYCEPEAGSHAGTMVSWVWDTINSEILDMHMGGGGEVYTGGAIQHFIGGNFNNGPGDPMINFGYGNTSLYAENLGGGVRSNVYGTGTLINWGQEADFTGQTGQVDASSTGPLGYLQAGNGRKTIPSQTIEFASDGNLTAPYTSKDSGFITPDEFNTSSAFESHPMTQGATFDDSSPVTHSYAACSVGNNGGFTYCNPFLFNQDGIYIGPDQRLVNGKYRVTMSIKDATQATNSVNIGFGSTCRSVGSYTTFAVPLTNAWPTTNSGYFTATLDLTSDTPGCKFAMAYNGATTADSVQTGFVSLSPLPQDFFAQRFDSVGDIFDGGQAGNSGKCVQFGSGGQLTAAAAACGSGGGIPYPSGTGIPSVTSGTAWGTTYTLSGSGTVLPTTSAPTIANPTFTGTTTGPSWGVDGSGNLTAASGVFAGPHTGIAGLGTSVLSLGSPAGSGATSPACASGVVCDSLSGTFTFTSGTSTTTGTIGTVTFPGTKVNVPTCEVQVRAGTTYFGEDAVPVNTSGTITLPITVAVALPASTATMVKVICFGQ